MGSRQVHAAAILILGIWQLCAQGVSGTAAAPLLRIAGSSTVRPVANAWRLLLPTNYTYELNGGGSSTGARRVCSAYDDPDHVDIGDMSRDWRTSEAERLDDGVTLVCKDRSTGERTDRRVTQIQVGIDGLAVVVQKNGAAHACLTSPELGGLTMAQLRWLFSDWTEAELAAAPYGNLDLASVVPNDNNNSIKEWSDLNAACSPVPIHPYGPGDQSGTFDFFAEAIFSDVDDLPEGFEFCNMTQVHHLEHLSASEQADLIENHRDELGSVNCYCPSEDDNLIRDWILADTGGIAFFGFAYYTDNQGVLTVIRVADDYVKGIGDTDQFVVTPDTYSIADGSYHMFTRRLYMNVDNTRWDLVRKYLEMGFSDLGQEEVTNVGYVRVNAAVHARMQNRIRDGENLAADFVPVQPDVCFNGTELRVTTYVNAFNNLKENYTCVSCPVGEFKWANTPTECEPCLAGSVTAMTGRSACDPCDRGEFAATTGLTGCAACPQGEFTAVRGATECSPCMAGTVQPMEGQVACVQCPAGQFQESVGMSDCERCDFGTYAEGEGLTACQVCGPGYFQSEQGANTSCSRCSRGNYSDSIGSRYCTPCGAGLTTHYTGAYSIAQCVCKEGTYMPSGKDATMENPCLPCPAGMACPVGSAFDYLPTVRSESFSCPDDVECPFPTVDKGYMTLEAEPLKVFKCLLAEQCPGGAPAQCAAFRSAKDVACGRCQDNAYKRGDLCEDCGDGPNVLFIFAAIALFIILLFNAAIALNRDILKQSNSTITIAVITGLTFTGLQSLGVFSSLNLTWFEPMRTIIEGLSVFGFDLSILRVSCQVGSGPFTNYMTRQLIAPSAVPFIFVALLWKKAFVNRNIKIWVEWLNTVGAIYSIFFISVVISAMSPFICYNHPGSNGASVVSQPSVLCFEDDVWYGLMVAGLFSLLLVTLPFLLICAYGTWQYPAMVLSHKPDQLNAFRFLFMRFKAETYYYGGILLIRNFCIPCIPALVRGDIAFQVVLMCTVVLLFMVVQMSLQPWRTFTVNLFDAVLATLLVLVLVCGTASSDFTAKEDSIMWLGTIIFTSVLLIVLVTFIKVLAERFWPANAYDGFVCHHKAGAAAQARYLKICLWSKGKQKIFIDSDDLQQLDGLFDIVRTQIGRLIVYLSKGTLSRPWCCGEIVTAHVNKVSTVVVFSADFVLPEKRTKDDWAELLDFNNSCLLQYGISVDNVDEAYDWLLDGTLTKIHLRTDARGIDRVQGVAMQLLHKSYVDSKRTNEDLGKDMLLISSDPDDDEASATAGILVAKVADKIAQMQMGSTCCLCDVDVELLAQDDEKLSQIVKDARANIVILTPRSMQCIIQLKVIIKAVTSGGFHLIPVSTPLYTFPTEMYYTHILPPIARQLTDKDLDVAVRSVRTFFKTIAVFFGTHSSDKVISTQALEIFNRVPKVRNASKDGARMSGSQTSGIVAMPSERGISRVSVRSSGLQDCAPTPPPKPERGRSSQETAVSSSKPQVQIDDDSEPRSVRSMQAVFQGVDDDRFGDWYWAVVV